MAFTVNFYTINKKQNSTALPSGAATAYSCTANDPMDLVDPVIILKISLAQTSHLAFNYCQIPSFSRYYWIKTWECRGGLWYAYLHVDPLASFKTAIGSNSCYVYRASYSYDLRIVDNLYPSLARQHRLNVDVPKVWTVNGANEAGAAANSGLIIAGIVSTDSTKFYAFTVGGWEIFCEWLFSDQFYSAVLTVFGASQYPEAKVAVNPIQFISSVRYVPIGVITSGYWGIRYVQIANSIPVGPTSFQYTGIAYELADGSTSFSIYDITITSDFLHPQADDRGDWLNYSPYTNYELFYPPFGLISLDPVDISSYTYLRIRLTLDPRTTQCMLEVQVYDTAANIRTIFRSVGDFGVDIPITHVMQPGSSFTQLAGGLIGSALGSAASFASGNILGGFSGLLGGQMSALGTAVNGRIPHVSQSGSVGTTCNLDGYPKLYVTHWYMADDDLAGRGRPLCQVKTLSAIPGYIMADSDEIHVSGATEAEVSEIREAVAEGFYYE